MNYCKQIDKIIELLSGNTNSSTTSQNTLKTYCFVVGDKIELSGLSEFNLSILTGEFTLKNTNSTDFTSNIEFINGTPTTTDNITLSCNCSSTTPLTSGAPKGYNSGTITADKVYELECVVDGCIDLDLTKLV